MGLLSCYLGIILFVLLAYEVVGFQIPGCEGFAGLRRSKRLLPSGIGFSRKSKQLFSSKQHSNTNDSLSHNDDDDEDDSEDSLEEKPYGNRSLAWTRRYRKLIPYSVARQQAIALGYRSKADWDEKISHGKYLINRPDEMYADEWDSWEEFLGLMRTYEETKHLVQYVLRLRDMEDYQNFIQSDVKRAEGLRIPAKPEVVYRDKGWVSMEDFFGEFLDDED